MSEHDGPFETGGIQMMGILNALKTGDMKLDIIIAMCIPIILRIVFSKSEELYSLLFDLHAWKEWWSGRKHMYERFIVHRTVQNSWGGVTSLDHDTKNAILIKSIELYLHYKCNLHLRAANLNLTSMENDMSGGYYSDDDEDSSRKTLVGMLSKYKVVEKPPHYRWHSLGEFGKPPTLVELQISQNEQTVGGGRDGSSGRQQSELTLHFVSHGAGAIDAFIDTAYEWYMNELRQLEDNSRYLYELQSCSSGGGRSRDDGEDEGSSGCLYTRYKLSDDKTFESLFFQQKERLLTLVDHFQDKSGKYSIKGYPHKLGLLLHGPPGSGKTSLIKALAQYTGRSIVNVPLAKISTNSELMSIFFDRTFHIVGEYVPVKLSFKDVIFVMEDVDASSRVVRRRDGKKTADIMQTEHVDLPLPKSLWRMMIESNHSDCRELVEILMEKSERLKDEATRPEVLQAVAQRMMVLPGLGLVGEGSEGDAIFQIGNEAVESADRLMSAYSTVDDFVGVHAKSLKALIDAGADVNDEFVDELLGTSFAGGIPALPNFKSIPKASLSRDVSYTKYAGSNSVVASDAVMADLSIMTEPKKSTTAPTETGFDSKTAIGSSLFAKTTKDQLNLTGLLNVLDGVVDCPGRLLVMTTNHPEQLDPALIRPGRIDKKLMLGYMDAPNVISMLEHYFQMELDTDQRRRVELAVNGSDLRPQLSLTPAQVEQLTAEADDIDEMICVLEEKGELAIAKVPFGHISKSAIKYDV